MGSEVAGAELRDAGAHRRTALWSLRGSFSFFVSICRTDKRPPLPVRWEVRVPEQSPGSFKSPARSPARTLIPDGAIIFCVKTGNGEFFLTVPRFWEPRMASACDAPRFLARRAEGRRPPPVRRNAAFHPVTKAGFSLIRQLRNCSPAD